MKCTRFSQPQWQPQLHNKMVSVYAVDYHKETKWESKRMREGEVRERQISRKRVREEYKALGQTNVSYWFIGGNSLCDRCKIDQMEGYPYSQKQAVCQYPSVQIQNACNNPWHSNTVQQFVWKAT